MPFFQAWGRIRTKRASTGCGTRFRTTSAGSVLAWKIWGVEKCDKLCYRIIFLYWIYEHTGTWMSYIQIWHCHTGVRHSHMPECAHTLSGRQSRDNPNMDQISTSQLSMCFKVKGSASGGWENLVTDLSFTHTRTELHHPTSPFYLSGGGPETPQETWPEITKHDGPSDRGSQPRRAGCMWN